MNSSGLLIWMKSWIRNYLSASVEKKINLKLCMIVDAYVLYPFIFFDKFLMYKLIYNYSCNTVPS